MRAQTASSHSLLWYAILLVLLGAAFVVVLSRSAANESSTVEGAASTAPVAATPVESR
jgi:hypothetical protein